MDADLSRMKRVPRVKTMRRALRCAASPRRTGDDHGPLGFSIRGAVDYDGYDRREILHRCLDMADETCRIIHSEGRVMARKEPIVKHVE